ncbi:MAG: ABC transporter permease [Actinomycetota bacterium]
MAVRTPPSSDLEGFEGPVPMLVATTTDRRRIPASVRYAIWAIAVITVIALGLRLSGGFPESLTVDVAAKFNQFNDWVIANQRTSPLFVNFLVPLRDGIQTTYDQLILVLSRMTWLGLVALAAAVAGVVAGWRLAVLAACGFAFMGVLGLWEPGVQTLGLMVFAVSIALLIGIPFGIWAGRRPSVERVIRPVLDAMQTIPAFSYLVPGVLLFGIGVPTALLATVIFAIPPAIRLTSLGIRQVPDTSLEVGRSFGTTSRQLLRRVQLPLAKPAILLGVNQTIMMALGIVVIAASVGVGGLGQVVLDGLNNLNVGAALAGGLAIVAMAIVLDRVTSAWGVRDRKRRGATTIHVYGREVSRLAATVLALVLVVVAILVGRQLLKQQEFPSSWTVSIGSPVNAALRWTTRTFGGVTTAITNVTVKYALDPLKSLLTDLPWWMVSGFAALIGWRVSRRWGLPVLAFACVAAVGVLGMWDDAMNTLSQVFVAVVVSVALAIPIGIWCARSDRVERAIRPILDTMQTMPQFVYLVPVVALFAPGRVPGVIAGLVYALPPGIRLTNLGIRQVPTETVEAAEAYGANPWQTLWKVQVPLARPSILLGVNQTVIMVFSVVIIAGLVGGAGLGLRVVNGLSHDPGAGMVAGICIMFLAIVIDRITQAMGQATRTLTTATRTRGWRSGPSKTRADAVATGVSDTTSREGEESI